MHGLTGFPYQAFTLRCCFPRGELAGQWISNYIRGAFGRHLRDLTCVCPRRGRDMVVHMETCPYSQIFESPTPKHAEIMRKYTNVPHPFVIYPSDVSAEGEFTVDLVLIGEAHRYFPYFVMTFLRMAQSGLGPRRTPFAIHAIESAGRVVYDPETNGVLDFESPQRFRATERDASAVKIELVSPLSLNRDGAVLREWDTRTFISALLRRIKNLGHFHGEVDLDIDFNRLLANAAERVTMTTNHTRWVARHRFSSRQDQVMRIDGLMGSVALEGALSPLLPYLELGAVVHNGKKTSFGNGKYELTYEKE